MNSVRARGRFDFWHATVALMAGAAVAWAVVGADVRPTSAARLVSAAPCAMATGTKRSKAASVSFVRGSDIMVASSDGRRAATLFRGTSAGDPQISYMDPASSADGACVAVTIGFNYKGLLPEDEINVFRGKQQFRLHGSYACCDFSPSWAPDGRRIVLQGGNGGLYIQGVGSKVDIRLTPDGDDIYDSVPSWSPDGSRIAFARTANDSTWLYLIRTNRTGLQPITITFADNPSWSPDARRLVFDDGRRIAVVNTDGTNLTYLTLPKGADTDPAWSPDGRTIAFVRHPSRRSTKGDVWLMSARGRNQRLFVKDGSQPAWKPR